MHNILNKHNSAQNIVKYPMKETSVHMYLSKNLKILNRIRTVPSPIRIVEQQQWKDGLSLTQAYLRDAGYW